MYKKFFIKLAFIIIPFLIIILFVNIKVDSGFVFNNKSEQIAEILFSKKNAAIITVPSQWGSLQKAIVNYQIQNTPSKPREIIVYGTSRASEVHSKMFPDQTFLNCAIPGGNILDYIALYGLYKESNLLPKYLIISLDPWTFHARKSVTINQTIQYISDPSLPLKVNTELINEMNTGMKYIGVQKTEIVPKSKWKIDNVIELFNPTYFQLNLKYLFRNTIIKTDNLVKKSYFVIRSDGGYSLGQQDQIDSILVKDKSNQFVNIHKKDFFISSDTNSVYWSYFEKLLLELKKDGVIPIIYISPINPIVYDHFAIDSNIGIENCIRQFCQKESILIIGSFNPHIYGYDYVGNNFMDSYHPVKSVVETVFSFHKKDLDSIGIKTSF